MTTDLLPQLSRRFPARDVKHRTQGGKKLHYIDIPQTINRFNTVLGPGGWSIERGNTEVRESGDGKYLATCEVYIVVPGALKYGVGAMENRDPDMAAKTALAEAIKKAGHQLGIGLQLWDERERDLVDVIQDGPVDLLQGDEGMATLKTAVQQLAAIEGVSLNATSIAAYFGVSTDDLQDASTLHGILAEAGLV